MNKINKLQDELPSTTHEFQLDLLGRLTKKRYLGEFSCKIPTIRDQALIAKHEAMLNGEFPVYLDGGVRKIHKMIAYLRFTLVDVPKFWRDADLGYDLRDDNVIDAVYAEVLAFEDGWLQKIWGAGEDTQEEVKDGPTEEKEG
jgi:hypothetical protein